MKLIKAKCSKDRIVEFEEKVPGVGTCPSYCPLKMRGSCYSKEFRYRRTLNDSVVADIPYMATVDEPLESATRNPIEPSDVVKPTPTVAVSDEREGDYIPFEDPFAEPIEVTSPEPPRSSTKASTADKYNSKLEESGLFAGIGARSIDEPCFADGVKLFYADRNRAKNAAGDPAAALRYIFMHWYTSKVFSADGSRYTQDFLYLLKLCNFRNREKELTDLIDDLSMDVNHKFFHLFYDIVYKNQLSRFYYSERESPFHELIPKFVSQQDFINKLLTADQTFFTEIEEYFAELLAWLQSFKNESVDKQWFLDQAPLLIAEYGKQIAYIDDAEGRLRLVKLGTIRNFIFEFTTPESYGIMERKCKFLSRFCVLPTGRVIARKNDFGVDGKMPDDSVYSFLEIKGASSYCASYYNFYTSILKEYIEVFHPQTLKIGTLSLSLRDFYSKMVNVVEEGYACILNDADFGSRRAQYFLVKNLLERGVLAYYEERCETSKLRELKKLFVDKQDPVAYFAFPDVNHKLYHNGRCLTISEYLRWIVQNKVYGELPKKYSLFQEYEVARAYFEAMQHKNPQLNGLNGKIEETIKAAEKIIKQFTA